MKKELDVTDKEKISQLFKKHTSTQHPESVTISFLKSKSTKLYNNAKKIIIVLDPDAWNDAERLYHKINCGKLMGKVWIVKLEGDKDIADLKGDLSEYKIKQID